MEVAIVAYVLRITVYCMKGSVRTVQHFMQYTVILSAYATIATGTGTVTTVAYVLRNTHYAVPVAPVAYVLRVTLYTVSVATVA